MSDDATIRIPSPWPPEVVAAHRDTRLWTGEDFGGFLRDRATRFADRVAVVDGAGERLTYTELDSHADRIAAYLIGTGVTPGQRVLVQVPNVLGYVPSIFGVWRAGALPVFTLPAHRRTELEGIARRSGAVAMITVQRHAGFAHADLARELVDVVPHLEAVHVADDLLALPDPPDPPAFPEVDPTEIAFLQLSGGTTGDPKLIPRTADDYLYSVRRSAEVCELSPETVFLCALPAAHNFPMSSPGILGVLHAGGRIVFAPVPDPATCFALIARERVTMTALVPPLALAWMDAVGGENPDLSSLRLLQVGGARFAPDAARRVPKELGCRLQQVFGMAEGLVCYTRLDDPDDLVTTTQGRPMSRHDEVRVVDAEGRPVPDGEPGRLETRGPYTIRGYHQGADPDAFTADGFYRSGDVVRRLPSGHLIVEGRVKDQINRGGEKISPDEVEDHLIAHPDVHDAVLVALPDDRLGERSCAVVVPAAGATVTAADLRRHLRGRGLAAFKMPDRFELMDDLPRTGVGKISRRDLRTVLAERLTPPPTGVSR